MRFLIIVAISLSVSVCAIAAPMARVQSIKNGRTLILEGGAEVRLGGIEVTNEVAAQELLRWTIGTSWILIERDPDGSARVYRSPDAMFLNQELVLRGYARATSEGIEPEHRIAATYLGVVNPGPRGRETTTAGASRPASGTGSGKSARSRAPRASRPRSPRSAK